jgi:hypothetical protein
VHRRKCGGQVLLTCTCGRTLDGAAELEDLVDRRDVTVRCYCQSGSATVAITRRSDPFVSYPRGEQRCGEHESLVTAGLCADVRLRSRRYRVHERCEPPGALLRKNGTRVHTLPEDTGTSTIVFVG